MKIIVVPSKNRSMYYKTEAFEDYGETTAQMLDTTEEGKGTGKPTPQEVFATLTKVTPLTITSVTSAIRDHDWSQALKVMKVFKSTAKALPKPSRVRLNSMMNRATSYKEMAAADESYLSRTEQEQQIQSYARAFDRILAEVKEVAAETATYEEKAATDEEQIFRSPRSKTAMSLRQEIMQKGFSLGQAPITLILDARLDRKLLDDHFNTKYLGQYVILDGQYVLGVTAKYALTNEFASPQECARAMGEAFSKKNGNRLEVMEITTTWQGASWAWIVAKTDLSLLSKAGGGRFNPKGWGIAYKDN